MTGETSITSNNTDILWLNAQGLSCIKQDRTLFDDFSLQIHAGELIHLVGPNGAGKTSLLRILVGLSEPDSGMVTVAEVPHAAESEALTVDYPLLYLGHKLGLNKYLSSVENLAYWASMHGIATEQEQLYALLARFNLVGLEDVPSGQLSAGQQRRVSLARTQLLRAHVWILDEPFTSLDIAGVTFIQGLVDDFVSQGGAVLMTSHQALHSRLPIKTVALEYRL
ncbi:MAG: cytochrome c biogenesis heme-transporting ATPase CcmA [Glaciecola sp.]|nr:cytochrome c biogenesis heme-transporting ATPase CcmA [Glaciecola sp.]